MPSVAAISASGALALRRPLNRVARPRMWREFPAPSGLLDVSDLSDVMRDVDYQVELALRDDELRGREPAR